MTLQYSCTIDLIVLGPFLTAATGPDRYGVDKSAHRNHMGRLVIPASHLKGKLRSSLEELESFFDPVDRPDLKMLFGIKSIEGSYEPVSASVHFSDLICANSKIERKGIERTRTRVTINRTSQTAQQNMLRELDDLFASGTEICFTGKVSFIASDSVDAKRLAGVLQLGLQWLATVGSEKCVGFGRLKSAQVGIPEEWAAPSLQMHFGTSNVLHLRIAPQEPLLIGGIKSRRTNYLASRLELTGGLIKGALAAALNEAHGRTPITRPLEACCASNYPGFESLVKHFSSIRVTHARPTLVDGPRPIRLPLSAVEYGENEFGDVALSNERTPLVHDRYSPAYYGDAKSLNQFEDLAKPVELFVTRSEIHDASQRTAEGQLFTYQFYAPITKEKKEERPIEWVCNVDFDSILDSKDRKAAIRQFVIAVHQNLHRLGKLGRTVTVEAKDGPAASKANNKTLIKDGISLVTLQSDTITLSPDIVRSLPLGQDLHEAYAAYWQNISDGALRLDDFFAHQGFEGGYRYHRYLGSTERKSRPDRYRPYYLTLAGSLFKLEVMDEEKATNILTKWLSGGLPLPKWALEEYGQYKRPL